MTNSEMEMCMWSKLFCYEYLETAFYKDEKSNTIKVGLQAVLSSEIIRKIREDQAETDKNLFKW